MTLRTAQRRAVLLGLAALASPFLVACMSSPTGTPGLPPSDAPTLGDVSSAHSEETTTPGGSAGVDTPAAPGSETPAQAPGEPEHTPTGGATEYPLPVETAREAFAATLAVQPDEIEVVEYEAVEWNDSSLGCPKPGQMYLQVITPGYRVVLAHGDEQATYHTSDGDRPVVVRCDRPDMPLIGKTRTSGSGRE